MLYTKNVPRQFWAECMKTTTYIINRLPQPKLGFVSPFEKLRKIKPTVKHFRVFGCVCYVFVPDQLRSKFDKKALRCIFLGYDSERKGWRCCDPTTNRCYTSRNVVFDEASSWWSQEITLPRSKDLDDDLQRLKIEETKEKDGNQAHEPDVREQSPPSLPRNHTSPWKDGVHQPRTPEEVRPSQLEID